MTSAVSSNARRLGPLTCETVSLPSMSIRLWDGKLDHALRGGNAAHDGLEIGWYSRGAADYRIGRREIASQPGRLVVVAPGVEHVTTFQPGGVLGCCAIEVGRALMDRAADACGYKRELASEIDLGASSEAALSHLSRAVEFEARSLSTSREGVASSVALEAIVDAFLVSLMTRSGSRFGTERRPASPAIRAAVEFMRTSLAEEIDVETLATSAGMSRFQLTRRFKEEMGAAPYEYLTALRVRHAAKLLERPACSVTAAAFDSGFRDLGRFGRAFRRELGVLPSVYRSR